MVKIGLRNLNCEEKLALALKVSKGLKSTPEFTSSDQFVEQLKFATGLLHKAITIASYGDKRGIEARNLLEKQLENIIRKTAAYVNHKAEGNPELIEAAGFEVRKKNNKPLALSKPQEVKITRTTTSGELKVSWKPVKNSRNYLVEYGVKNTGNKTKWNVLFSTRSRCVMESLTPGTIYKIRVVAVGAKGKSTPSETLEIMAT